MKIKRNDIFIAIGVTILLGVGSFALLKSNVYKQTISFDSGLSTASDSALNKESSKVTPTLTPIPTPTPKFAEDFKARALYLSGWTVGSDKNINRYIELAKKSQINSYVINIKDDDGLVGYKTNIDEVKKVNGWKYKYDVDKAIKAFNDNDIYLIGRVVCFKDPVYATARPDLAIKHRNGGIWKDKNGRPWLDPYNKGSWPYIVEIAREGIEKGFNEIQFDYIRFANDGDKNAMDFSMYGEKKKYEAINEFIDYAKEQLPGAKLSADVFGIICESPEDTEGIGQYLELIGKNIDYISPMVYPSHYYVGQVINGVKFHKPDTEPYEVVYQTLKKAKERISKVPDYKAKVRPYIQGFTAPWLGQGYYISYGDEQIRAQIKAVQDAGFDEWIVWEAGNNYSDSAYIKEVE